MKMESECEMNLKVNFSDSLSIEAAPALAKGKSIHSPLHEKFIIDNMTERANEEDQILNTQSQDEVEKKKLHDTKFSRKLEDKV